MNTKHVPNMLTRQTCAVMHRITFGQTIIGRHPQHVCQTKSLPNNDETRSRLQQRLLVRVTQILVYQSFKISRLSWYKLKIATTTASSKGGQGMLNEVEPHKGKKGQHQTWRQKKKVQVGQDSNGFFSDALHYGESKDQLRHHNTKRELRLVPQHRLCVKCSIGAVGTTTEIRQIDFIVLDVDC